MGENTEKYITFTVPIEKQVTKNDKPGEQITKNICHILQFTDSASLWQVHYQILSIIFLREFIKLNVNLDMMIKNLKHLELNVSIGTVFLNTQNLKMI